MMPEIGITLKLGLINYPPHYLQLRILLFLDEHFEINRDTSHEESGPIFLIPFSAFIQHCQVIAYWYVIDD